MVLITVVSPKGRKVGEVVLDSSIFGVEPNIGLMHQVVTAQLAARRAGTHSTKSRAEVAGGGAKPWRQKGTGRARHGSTRSPQWRGGGAAHGPKPRDYRQRTPKKMKRLALASALSDRARSGRVIVVDRWRFEAPRTRDAKAALDAIGATGRVLVVIGDGDSDARKSFRNLESVHCLSHRELNTYDVLNSDLVVFTADTLPQARNSVAPESEHGNDDGSEHVSDDGSEHVSDDGSEHVSDDGSEHVSEGVSDDGSEHVSDDGNEDVSEGGNEDVSEDVDEHRSEAGYEDVSEDVDEHRSEAGYEDVSEDVDEHRSEAGYDA